MCGICGIISFNKIDEETAKQYQNIMVECESRGEHAFGYAMMPEAKTFKATGSVSEYIKKNPEMYKKFVGKTSVLAHTRFATGGSPKIQRNNHPFVTQDFVLAHNGVISNHREFKYKTKIETDSFVIVQSIQENYDKKKGEFKTEDEAIENAIIVTGEKLMGNFACWLLHKKTGTIYLFRTGNPIEIVYSPEKKAIFFASERSMFYPILSKTDVGSSFIGGLYNTTIQENTVYKITTDGLIKLREYIPCSGYISQQYQKFYEVNDSGVIINSENKQLLIGSHNTAIQYEDEKTLETDLYEVSKEKLEDVREYLETWGIELGLINKSISLTFSKDSYDMFSDIFRLCGYEISPTTKRLHIPNVDELGYVINTIDDSDPREQLSDYFSGSKYYRGMM